MIEESKLLTGARKQVSWIPRETADYVLVIGENPDELDFGTNGTVAISQDGINFTDLDDVQAATRKVATVVGGRKIHARLTCDGGSPMIKVGIYQIGTKPSELPSSSSSSSSSG